MPMRKVSEQDKGIRTLNQGRPRLCLSLTQFKRGDTSFEPGGTGKCVSYICPSISPNCEYYVKTR